MVMLDKDKKTPQGVYAGCIGLVRIMLNGVGRLSSVSTTNVCRRDGDVEYSNCERYKSREDMMRMKWA